MSVPYIISRRIDPVFALSVGIAAAAVRINREEKEKGKTTEQTVDSLKRRWALAVGNADAAKVETTGGG